MSRLRRPASLRGRVVLGVLGLLSLLLVALFVAVDLTLAARLRSDLRTRLEDRVALAEQLDGALSPQQLVDRLTGDGVQVALCTPSSSGSSSGSSNGSGGSSGSSSSAASSATSASTFGGRCVSPRVAPSDTRPSPPGSGGGPGGQGGPAGRAPGSLAPAPKKVRAAAITKDGSNLYVRTTLPQSGQQLSLSVDGAEVGDTVRGLILSEVVGGLLMLAVAALLLGRVVGVALRPLDQMTALARRIAGGDRGRRLDTTAGDTELGRTATAFDDMLDELEAAVRTADGARDRLRQFLGDASHELRSPLTGLQARAEQLLRDEPEREQREQVYVAMVRETRRANRLVDDLLTVARFDGAPADLQLARVDLVDAVRQELDRVRLRAPDATLGVDGVPSAVVQADPQRLAQILGNLLDNAARAVNRTGTVTVTVQPDGGQQGGGQHGGGQHGDGQHGGGHWVVDVRDDGPGVPDADRERIFDRLVRLDASRTRDTGGFGLGLPIARALARAHGGSLVCLPADHGALFRLTLPSA